MTQEIRSASGTSICLRPINSLLNENFMIPDYQRGYRWGKQQVRELLEDILKFQTGDGQDNRSRFYCLQPVVVKENHEHQQWEVVDGQQRLTTIFLILQFFNKRLAEEYRRSLFEIDYQTRTGSKEFLSSPTRKHSDEYIDFHFMYQAKETIEDWFQGKDHLVNDFEAALLNRVKVIWYQLPEIENAIDAFTRLNVGKIPLTNAELIRALFLRSGNFNEAGLHLKQLKLAQEWDQFERTLQNDDFWCFLTENMELTNRIELIFNLITENNPGDEDISDLQHGAFHRFSELISSEGTDPEKLWDDVKQYFMTISEWYADAKLFHLVGYLINQGDSLLELIQLSGESGKKQFCRKLKLRILDRLLPHKDALSMNPETLEQEIREYLDGVEYGSAKVKPILLLFNIASIIANDKSIVRFRFDYFKNENWDIEHIRSVESGRPNANRDKKPWLETIREYFAETGENQELRSQADEMLSSRSYTTVDAFDILYDKIILHFDEHESSDTENGLGNLALLDSSTNRGYKNAVFPIKRRKILLNDQEGTFVPLCTRNAFLKCYSEKVDNMFFWGVEDQADYRNAMVKTLSNFFHN